MQTLFPLKIASNVNTFLMQTLAISINHALMIFDEFSGKFGVWHILELPAANLSISFVELFFHLFHTLSFNIIIKPFNIIRIMIGRHIPLSSKVPTHGELLICFQVVQ
jgi:hypothetical protein